MPETDPPPFTHLRLPFCFVPRGANLPADWAAAHPASVKFAATLRMRSGNPMPPQLLPISPGDDWLPPDETATSVAHADAQQFQPHDARSVVPRIARPPRQPPRLPAHRTPMPGTYTDPKTLLAAFGGTTARAEGRAVLIRSAQVMLDELASQEAARAAAVADKTQVTQPLNLTESGKLSALSLDSPATSSSPSSTHTKSIKLAASYFDIFGELNMTVHTMIRMNERGISPTQLTRALRSQALPGTSPGTMNFSLGGVTAIVNEDGEIVTVY